MISPAGAVPSTPRELVSRLTEQDVTPGTAIYSNPFARYDAALVDSPFDDTPQRVSIVWTLLYNLLLLVLFGETVRLWLKYLLKR